MWDVFFSMVKHEKYAARDQLKKKWFLPLIAPHTLVLLPELAYAHPNTRPLAVAIKIEM